MPAEKYGFKATPAQMTFGELMLHIAGENDGVCAGLSASPAPDHPKLDPTAPKDSLVARLKQSFEFCTTALASWDDSKLGEEIPFFGRRATQAYAAMELPTGWGDHYGLAAVYLRLNGLLATHRPQARLIHRLGVARPAAPAARGWGGAGGATLAVCQCCDFGAADGGAAFDPFRTRSRTAPPQHDGDAASNDGAFHPCRIHHPCIHRPQCLWNPPCRPSPARPPPPPPPLGLRAL